MTISLAPDGVGIRDQGLGVRDEGGKMKVVLVGYGKMGKALEARLIEKGHEIAGVVDPVYQGATLSGAPLAASLSSLATVVATATRHSPLTTSVAIEFTHPSSAVDNLLALAELKIPTVCGTTGWYERLDEVRAAVEKNGSALLWASNFSLGVNLFYKVAEYAAKLFDAFPEYDTGGFEVHHNKKADSPSGTAKTLAGKVLAQMTRKTKAVYDKLERPPEADELHFASLRVGAAPGLHSLVFDSGADTVEITHTARSRDGLVSGAIAGAEWLCAEKRSGVFRFEEII
jgi:4-hydroxy-tetrahydrodipicolinate reductase